MPFDRPTLPVLVERTRTDATSRLTTDEQLRRADAEVFARVQAGAVHGLYGYLDYIANQVMPDTAEAGVLERHASIWGITRRPAEYATGTVAFTGTTGAVVPAGTLLKSAAGIQFATAADATLAAGTAAATVTAVAAGASGNLPSATVLNLVSPIAGVQSAATVQAPGTVNGSDIEADDSLRARVLSRIRQAPHGGADFDYTAWALEVPGVTRAWVYPLELGAGTVTVRFVRDDDASPIPDAAEVAAVQAYIDALRPVTAAVTVVAPVAVPLNFTISGLTPDTAAIRAAVEAELADLLRREAEPEGGAGEGTILLSHIREAVSLAAGEADHVLVSPAANVTHTLGQIATMGTVTWA